MPIRSKQVGWSVAAALALSCHGAWCAEDVLTLGSLARSSQHILVGRVLSTEVVSASVGNRSVDCGVSASIRVLENVIGTAPEIITVGFQEAPLTGASYFLPLTATTARPTTDTAKTPVRDGDATRALRACENELPQLWANPSAIAEIVQLEVGHPDHATPMEFLQIPTALWLPGLDPVQTYAAAEPVPDAATVEGQLMPPSLRTGARITRWYDLRRRFCRVTDETSGPRFCN